MQPWELATQSQRAEQYPCGWHWRKGSARSVKSRDSWLQAARVKEGFMGKEDLEVALKESRQVRSAEGMRRGGSQSERKLVIRAGSSLLTVSPIIGSIIGVIREVPSPLILPNQLRDGHHVPRLQPLTPSFLPSCADSSLQKCWSTFS